MVNNKKKRSHKKKSQGPKQPKESTSEQIKEVGKDDDINDEKLNENAAGPLQSLQEEKVNEAKKEEKLVQLQEECKADDKVVLEEKPIVEPKEKVIKLDAAEVNILPEEAKVENEESQKVNLEMLEFENEDCNLKSSEHFKFKFHLW